MLVCHCSLAGTAACFRCPRYREYFDAFYEYRRPPYSVEIDHDMTKQVKEFLDKSLKPQAQEEPLDDKIRRIIREELDKK